jgi:hypothetical protein
MFCLISILADPSCVILTGLAYLLLKKIGKEVPIPGRKVQQLVRKSFFKAWPVKNLLALMEGFALQHFSPLQALLPLFERVVEAG